MPEFANQLDGQPDGDRNARDEIPKIHDPGRDGHQHDRRDRQIEFEVIEYLDELGHDPDHDKRENKDGYRDDHGRIDHRSFHLAFERFGPFLEFGQALEDDFKRAARFARLDHVDVEPIERFGRLAHPLGKRRSAFDLVADVYQRVFEPAPLRLAFEDSQASEDRQAGVLQNGKLAREGTEILAGDAAER